MFGIIGLCSLFLRASDIPSSPQYSLSVAQVYESSASKPEWVFIFGGVSPTRGGETVCKTISSLKKLLSGLPRGSTLDWWPTCHGESEVLKDHLEELKKICAKAGITFTIHPAG